MSRPMAYAALLTLLAAAGCANVPELADEAPAATAVAAIDDSAGAVADPSTFVPDTVVDANDLVARTPAPVICRDILRRNSNVHVTQCMTAEDWERYRRQEARDAAELVRSMQRGTYRY